MWRRAWENGMKAPRRSMEVIGVVGESFKRRWDQWGFEDGKRCRRWGEREEHGHETQTLICRLYSLGKQNGGVGICLPFATIHDGYQGMGLAQAFLQLVMRVK